MKHHQTLFLKTADGKEKPISFVNFPINFREGHTLTVWGWDKNTIFQAYNHDTGEIALNNSTINEFAHPHLLLFAIMVPVVLLLIAMVLMSEGRMSEKLFLGGIITIVGAFAAYLVLLIPLKIIEAIRANKIRQILKALAAQEMAI